MHRALAAALTVVLASSCSDRVGASLLELHGVEEPTVEAGELLRIRAAGLPPGRAGEVSFEGVAHRPGVAPIAVAAHATGVASTAETFTVTVDDALTRALGGRGTFVGVVRVALMGSDERVRITGSLDAVELDVRGASPRGAEALALGRRGRSLLDALGAVLDDEAAPEMGIAIASVRSGSPAARAGVRPGDAIVSVGSVRTSSIEDCAAPPRSSVIDVRIRRPGRTQPIDVHLSLAAASPRGEPAGVAPAALLAGVLAFVLLTFSPAARITVRSALAVRRRTRAKAREGAPPSEWSLRRAFGALVAAMATLAALGIVPLTARAFPRACDAMLLAAVALFAQVLALGAEPGPRLGRARKLAGFVLAVGPFVAALVLASGTASIPELVEVQGALPWEWRIARDPVAPLALLAAIAGGLAPRAEGRSGQIVEVAERIRMYAIAAVVVSALLGGYGVPGVEGDALWAAPVLRVVAVVVFVAKAAMLVRIGDGFGALAPRVAPSMAAMALGLSALAVAALLFAVGAPEWTGRFVLAVVLGAVAALLVELAIGARATRPRVELFV